MLVVDPDALFDPDPPPVLMTRWMVMPSLMEWVARLSWSLRILPAKMRQSWATGAENSAETFSLNYIGFEGKYQKTISALRN